MPTALVGVTLLDGTGRPPRPATTLVLDGPVIQEVGREREFGPDVQVVDLRGATLMPGLIDCHMHLAPWGMRLIQHQQESLMLLAARTVQALRATLAAGFTGVDP